MEEFILNKVLLVTELINIDAKTYITIPKTDLISEVL